MRLGGAFLLTLLSCGTSQQAGTPDTGIAAVVDSGADAASLCVDGKSTVSYPSSDGEIAVSRTLPNLEFDSVTADGARTRIALREYYAPCAGRPGLLVVRVGALWCGSCRWDYAHTKALRAALPEGRVELLDLLIADDDNAPATTEDLSLLGARTDAIVRAAIDPAFKLHSGRIGYAPLPAYAIVDRRTMKLLVVLDDPATEEVVGRVTIELDELDGKKTSPPAPPKRVDGLRLKDWDMLRDMKLPEAPPPDPTNAKADDPAAAKLGQVLFSDTSMSPTGTVSCASCHDGAKSFADGRPQSLGVAVGDRNAPSILLASHARWQFWDGRADTLWAQATGPFENPAEFGSSRLFVAHAVRRLHRAQYETVFGPLPALEDGARFPPSGKPGEPAWAAMATADQVAVTRVFVNVAKAIAAFERTLRVKPNALDRFAAGDLAALTPAQRVGLRTYFSAGCAQCHYGPRLTDDAFHVLRFPTGRKDGKPDEGRSTGIASLLASEFRSDGPFSDAKGPARRFDRITPGPWTVGAFKTPTLRALTTTGPYGHSGTIATLADLSKMYSTAGLKTGDPLTIGERELWVGEFVELHTPEITAIMEVLSGDPR